MSRGLIQRPNVVPAVTGALRNLGFHSVGRSRSSSSRYLRRKGSPFTLRVSDHEPVHSEPHVVHSATAPDAVAASDIPCVALEIGVAFVFQCRQRLGIVGEIAA